MWDSRWRRSYGALLRPWTSPGPWLSSITRKCSCRHSRGVVSDNVIVEHTVEEVLLRGVELLDQY